MRFSSLPLAIKSGPSTQVKNQYSRKTNIGRKGKLLFVRRLAIWGVSGLSVPPQKPFPGMLSCESFKENKRSKLNL